MTEPQQLHLNVRLEDGSLWATVDEYLGVFATGDNLEKLRESLQEGIALVLADPGGESPKDDRDGHHGYEARYTT